MIIFRKASVPDTAFTLRHIIISPQADTTNKHKIRYKEADYGYT